MFAALCAVSLLATNSGFRAPISKLDSGWQLQDVASVPDSGATISSPGFQPIGWNKATVPGTVLTSLVNDGVYPEPLYGENNKLIPEALCHTSYWYRTSFFVPKSDSGKHVWLRFDGINYAAEVWLNGQKAGSIRGAFVRGTFDITSMVTTGSIAGLAVKVDPQPHPGQPHQKTIATGTGRNGGDSARDGATFLCTIGWDWIPTIRDRDTGIWQGVSVYETGPVAIRDPYVASDLPLPRTDSADLSVETTLVNVSGSSVSGVLTGSADGIEFQARASLRPGESKRIVLNPENTPSLRVRNPRLWWPNGYGAPNLYKMHLAFQVDRLESLCAAMTKPETSSTIAGISDEQDVRFGIRKIDYTLPGSGNLAISVNGVPVFCKGGDWGVDEAMKRIGHKRLEAQIRLHQLANYTMIRNWVGQSTSEDFYSLCDKYGILVWDEFFQPNPSDGPNPDDVDAYLSNVKDKLLRFRNHPCIALWCARNEGDPPPLIDAGIDKLYSELDGRRLYHANSGSGRGTASGGPYRWREPRKFYVFGDAFKTEVGSVSFPTLEALHAMMPEKDWETINDDWAEHDFCRGAQGADQYPAIAAKRYGPIANTADLVRKGQLMNYEAYRAMYEGRNARLFKPATGVLTWMSNPAQPSVVWQLYTHDLEPNASLFGARKACEPIHIQVNQSDWHAMVINNTRLAIGGTATISIHNLDGALVSTHTIILVAGPGAATDIGQVESPPGASQVHFISAKLFDARGRLLSDNFYWRAKVPHSSPPLAGQFDAGPPPAPAEEDDFTALNQLPTVSLDIHAHLSFAGDRAFVTAEVSNPTKSIALMSHLQLRRPPQQNSSPSRDVRVLPVYYSDNYFSLLPGERRSVSIECARDDLKRQSPEIAVDGWNVTSASPSSPGQLRVFANPSR